ncbi:coiled-coil domain-containing protein 66 isoform X2 [Ascaphus truei]|uniref:coiled-coil domain-containing protein 66 isoform X2 n=1 Tax=Ascaphus truei TaxID=8439 RepID=UPI003F5A4455
MNLGDGLKLETQILNGKTKLILAPYGALANGNKQAANKARAQNATLKTKQPGQTLKSVQSYDVKAEQPAPKNRSLINAQKEHGIVPSDKPHSNVLKELENKRLTSVLQQNVQPGKTNPVSKKSLASKVYKPRPKHNHAISAEELRESLVCLTQEQFQQILMTINQGSQSVSKVQSEDGDADTNEASEETIAGLLTAGAETSGKDGHISALTEKQDLQTVEQTTNMQNARQQGGNMFSTLGEGERGKSLQEVKKAQWKKELDEQIAIKKKMKASAQERALSRHHTTHGAEYPGQSKEMHVNDTGAMDQDDLLPKTSTSTETSESPPVSNGPSGRASSFSSPELPAAIRTAFVLGEAAPLDHPFSAVKRQQQKKWLEELNKQRDELILRKMQEKQKLSETEEPDRWAMHFDSFKKQNDPPNTARKQQSENPLPSPELADPVPLELPTSPTPSYPQRAGSGVVKSAEEDHVQGQKAGFLRTMTALLDPVQIEERDKRRVKQLEHQKAIAAQVEEKRKRKQLEVEQRQREEQEEEQRLAREREQMQKHFEDDAIRQKQKEEVLSLKTKELYQSMQRAQEEAQRIKQEQRMRNLAQKGHDISKLQKNLSGDAVQLDFSRSGSRVTDVTLEDNLSGTNSVMKETFATLTSARKDTGVQTDAGMYTDVEIYAKETVRRHLQRSSPDIPIELKNQQKAERHQKKMKSQREKSGSRKENKNIDTYEHFARTEKQVKENGRRPDWNKNKPSKQYVPASERYPKGLRKQREESKIRRQMELLNLVDKTTANNQQQKKRDSPRRSPSPHADTKGRHTVRKEEQFQKVDSNFKRPDSPPVPAVKNRLHQTQKRQTATSNRPVYSGNSVPGNLYTSTKNAVSPESSEQESERPPSSHFIPYVRTREIYYLDPDAPMSRPSTHDPQYRHDGDCVSRQIFSSDHARDPLLNPNVVKNRDRQQAILKGLSELRKGLLQKQKELETGLIPDLCQE